MAVAHRAAPEHARCCRTAGRVAFDMGRASFRPSADDAERARRVEELIRADARLSRLLDVVAKLPAKEIDLLLSIADDLRKRNE